MVLLGQAEFEPLGAVRGEVRLNSGGGFLFFACLVAKEVSAVNSCHLSRRMWLKSVATGLGSAILIPGGLARGSRANEAIQVGIIATGGRGRANMEGVAALPGVRIVALCEVDRGRLQQAAQRYPGARTDTDFRHMLDHADGLDAVVISTPDHTHAAAAVRAMRQGLHCFCEKPLTRSVYEARVMREVAAEQQVVTQMGTPARGNEDVIRLVEIIRSGALGDLIEAHYWTNRPIWPQGFDRPSGEEPVPESLDWESWIGPAPMRPFVARWPAGHPVYDLPDNRRRGGYVYHPFVWRGWWDFGTGALGDIAPHQWHSAYWGLELGAPSSVQVLETSGPVTEMFPAATTLQFDFAATGDRPTTKIFWYDGGHFPPADLLAGATPAPNGSLLVGTKAVIGPGHQSVGDFEDVPRTLRRPGGLYQSWVDGIRHGDPREPSCAFDYAGPLNEACLLGNIALKMEQRIEWDGVAFRITNSEPANQYLHAEYRSGWEL